jgi:hypothetical protein
VALRNSKRRPKNVAETHAIQRRNRPDEKECADCISEGTIYRLIVSRFLRRAGSAI